MSSADNLKITGQERAKLIEILRGLMLAETLGDFHDEIFGICDLIGIPRLIGNYAAGWTEQDWESVELPDTTWSLNDIPDEFFDTESDLR